MKMNNNIKTKSKYLNLGCGARSHKDWINVDLHSDQQDILAHDLSERLPFDDNIFEVVYLSQVLEHIYKTDSPRLIGECYRVLKKGGIIRIVVPDLEDIVNNYLQALKDSLKNPSKENEERYSWILLEMYDQAVRSTSGGEMAEFIRRDNLIDENYIFGRIGLSGKIISKKKKEGQGINRLLRTFKLKDWHKALEYLRIAFLKVILSEKEFTFFKMGKFRMGGEIHHWMYDRYSLGKLLEESSFKDIKKMSSSESSIPGWGKYDLDVKDGQIYDPTSLFMEAKK
jgi:predicted SAM-dependent methyltransferase